MTTSEPEHIIPVGLVEAAIWKKEGGENGSYNVTFERLYQPKGEKTWKSTKNFERADLLSLAQAATQAFLWIHQH